jgi:hypothetical protein
MRKTVVSGPTTKFRPSHTAQAAVETMNPTPPIPAIEVHDYDPTKEQLERPKKGHLLYAESPVGRAAVRAPVALSRTHTPAPKIDSPGRSPQSAKLEAERAALTRPESAPQSGLTPVRALSTGKNLTFVKDDVAHGVTVLIEARPRSAFLPSRLSIVHESADGELLTHWRIFGLSVNGIECLREDLRESGVHAYEIPDDAFDFVTCAAGAPIFLRARNDSGKPVCLQAILVGSDAETPDKA